MERQSLANEKTKNGDKSPAGIIYADYESQIKNRKGDTKFMDLFWPGMFLVEMKSKGKNLDLAMNQALGYYTLLSKNQEPRYILACDFENWYLRDKKENTDHWFTLSELADNIGLFGFMTNRPKTVLGDPVNIKAAEIIGCIFDSLKEGDYPDGEVEYFLTRVVFCLFADDTGIFQDQGMFQSYIRDRTREDGSDLSIYLDRLFRTLNQRRDDRPKMLDSRTRAFPYINGDLFGRDVAFPEFDHGLRDLLIQAGDYDWSKVSPVIFGTMCQTVMDRDARARLGVHYTIEENILKVIRPLFLDELNAELDEIEAMEGASKIDRLCEFQDKLAGLRFFDPACGSGNFLVITYRELRNMERRIIMMIYGYTEKRLDADKLSKVNVNQFYGIEIARFSARIAEISLWMMDHRMNLELSKTYGLAFRRIPISERPHIRVGDALEFDWSELLPVKECSYILGNPPFGGSKKLSKHQRAQIKKLANLGGSGGTLDYVTGWYLKAAQYIDKRIHVGLVSTNSITRGEQVGQLWPLIYKHGVDITFAYDSFLWESDAEGKASVTVVIIGLAKGNGRKRLFLYDDDGETIEGNPEHISPYLVGSNKRLPVVVESSKNLNGLSKMIMGSKPIDDGEYIFDDEQKSKFLEKEPDAEQFMRPYINARDFLNNKNRWILALHDVEPIQLRRMPEVAKRVENVKKFRGKSISEATRKLAETPTRYHLNVLPGKPFLVIPGVSSEKRKYVPIGYVEPPAIPSNATLIIENATLGLFGLLTSAMHVLWLKTVGGRLKNDVRYSAGIVYNTFPMPEDDLRKLEPYAQKILDVRKEHETSSLADMYDPTTMPDDLKKAHKKLDRMVEKLYRKEQFESDQERIEYLLEGYQNMVGAQMTL